jgi:hypothetical protein
MANLKNYLHDGAGYQARAVLMFLQENANIKSSWNQEYKWYDANINVSRWENGREQGYIVSLMSKKFNPTKQLNIAFFEHRNSDNICAIKWEQVSINALTISNAIFNDVYRNKHDVSYIVEHGEAYQMATWIIEKFIEFWDKHN